MPWPEVSAMDARLSFVAASLRQEEAMSSLCLRYGISRKTGYKWLGRYMEAGAAGLEERSSAPRQAPHAISGAVAAPILALRRQRPTWGPRKLLARLAQDRPEIDWPAASTVGDLLRREGLSQPRRRGRERDASAAALLAPQAANEVWSADFKGWFRTGDGVRCEPLTVADGYSRYLLACQAVPRIGVAEVRPIFERLFREHGLPRALRTDNGSPFANLSALGGLTKLSVWLLKLDILPERIAPGRPAQNGRHERMHRTLAAEPAQPPAASLAEQQRKFDLWREDFNHQRPHEALGQRCPGTVYAVSPRGFPERLQTWDYPADQHIQRVSRDGYIRWQEAWIYLSEALAKETIALAQRDDGDWTVRFRGFDLAILTEANQHWRRPGLARSRQPRTNSEDCHPGSRVKL